MNKNAIKKFAIEAREDLISRVMQKAAKYGITEENIGDPRAESISGRLLTPTEKSQRQKLIEKIKQDGYKQVMEAAAYTWFNRFIALRFMEVNKYLPSRVRVFTDADGNFAPQILDEALTVEIDGVNRDYVIKLLSDENKDELYKYLLIKQCNALGSILPGMFQKIDDWTELLFPDNIRRTGSVLHKMVTTIPQEDWDVTTLDENGEPQGQVQIIGWLYQYYNSVPKDKVFENLKKNIKISKNDIPAATQLFTPDWIVRYMVENSLGRIVINNLKYGDWNDEEKAKIDGFKAKWKYYLEEAKQEPEVEEQLRQIELNRYPVDGEEQIFIDTKFIDPCMGSGHILVYAFEVFMDIYKAMGWSERDAALRIIDKNLWGLDIDDRAAQLAYFVVMMKARQYDRNFFRRGAQPHILTISESGHYDADGKRRYAFDPGALDEFVGDNAELKTTMNTIIEELFDAKEYGSILNVTPQDFEAIYNRFNEVQDKISIYTPMIWEELLPIVQTAEAISKRYEIVITNPPYAGAAGLNNKMCDFLKQNYPISKSDLFSAFIEKCVSFCKKDGYVAMITQQAWMFLSSFETMREQIITQSTLASMTHLGNGAFGFADFGLTAFVILKHKTTHYLGIYNRLVDENNPEWKRTTFLKGDYRITTSQDNYSKIPGSPIAYWVSDNVLSCYGKKYIYDYANPCKGIDTGDNSIFLRFWHEPELNKMFIPTGSPLTSNDFSIKKWFPYNKGGDYRKWYGNNEYLLDWENNGNKLRNFKKSNLRNKDRYFEKGITWSTVTSGESSFRFFTYGFLFDNGGSCLFASSNLSYIQGFLNSCVARDLLHIQPTVNNQPGTIGSLPLIIVSQASDNIESIVKLNIEISKKDWDSFETSWDFKVHPFVEFSKGLWDATAIGASLHYYYGTHPKVNSPLEICYLLWQGACNERFKQLKENEEELNRIFIDIYGLQDELTPEVEDKDVTVRKADLGRDIRSFISYAVGCMFGRYSLDREGLVFAGGDFDDVYWLHKGQAALDKQGNPIFGGYAGISMANYHYPAFRNATDDVEHIRKLQYEPDRDNIIPICDDEYFEDDIVGRFVEFVKAVFGPESLEANLKFIADALGGKGTPRDVIRSYFVNDFYADHLKVYQKRPIYWLFDSGKKNGFKALIYMHRYQPDTLARMRTDYIHEQQARYRTAIDDVMHRMDGASTSERVKLNKTLQGLQDQAEEIRVYEEKIHHLADQMIRIDLDDGVKHNYEIFKDVLAPIK